MQQAVARELPHVIAVSEATKRRTADDFGVASGAMRVVHNGIDTDRFAPRDDVGGSPLADASGNPRIVTTVSADTPLKGARYLISAFARVRSRMAGTDDPDPELVVVGEFDEGGATERLAAGLGIEDAITTHSEITDAALVDLYASATLAVVPSLYEGASTVSSRGTRMGRRIRGITSRALWD
jgi:glycosyltransferase involved in cell wall biosynthesis